MNKSAKSAIGHTIRKLREQSKLSQEKLAELSNISYQYLSALENGKENFSIGVLESIAVGLGTTLSSIVQTAFANDTPIPKLNPKFLIKGAKLPPLLTPAHLEAVLNETHRIIRLMNTTLRQESGRPLAAYIQGNNFSGIVSNILCDSFSRLSPYKHNHDQRYPDLVCKNKKGNTLAGLEVKCTIKPGKGGESHNGHSGWHVVACFSIIPETGDIKFVHVMFADLVGYGKPSSDWKYVPSKRNADTGSQRTETYTTTPAGTAKLRHGTIFLDHESINISRWRTLPGVKAAPCSPFIKKKTIL
ncbi:MAG: helix-turn-helix transcriptional regulator [Kiritimatiellae bacterium]|nr:helix-turn-helix transcriptional regulator [Kiritimatiellia bacterium]MDD4735861.1 helix-turn-helix transcriptional regulator [Kiritimatiellia bacterium]